MRRILLAAVAAISITGCANVAVTVRSGGSGDAVGQDKEIFSETDTSLNGEQPTGSRRSIAGPYGELCVDVPSDWECRNCTTDSDEMSYGYYGFIMHPMDAKDGIIALFCARGFGVCGTELKQEETMIAGKPARIGTYDDHDRWDFIVIGDEEPQIVATNGTCDSWTDDQWNMAQEVIGSVSFDPSVTAGGVWQYIPESEDTGIGVSMDLSDITPSGATVHFYRFDTGNAGEISYGERFTLEKENAGKWEALPEMIDDAAFNDIAYIIPNNDSCQIETNWEWLYGPLSPGTYRMRKTVLNRKDDGYTEHELTAQFLVAGPGVKTVVEGDFGTYYEMSDGTWMYEGRYYKYRLEINGRMNNAAKDSTFIYLSNIEDIPFDRAVMASGLGSDTDDYFPPDEAVFIGWKD